MAPVSHATPPFKLVACDLDGTLLPPGGRISDGVKAAVRAAQAAGVLVTLASGRTFGAAAPYARDLGLDAPLICCNGALIRHPRTGVTLHEELVPAALMAECLAYCHGRGWYVVLFMDDAHDFERAPERLDSPTLQRLFDHAPVSDLPALLVRDATKCIVVGETEAASEAQMREMERAFGDRMSWVRSYPLLIEGMPPGTSKGRALALLAGHLRLGRTETVAIGDNDNDLEMLRWAGLSLAMGNATPNAVAAARHVLPPVWEDGAAWGIAHYVLNGYRH